METPAPRRPPGPPDPRRFDARRRAFAWASEIGVLFGPSGSGKTSILRLITGLSRPITGYVRLGDATLFDCVFAASTNRCRRRRIGMIFQDDLLFPAPERRRQHPVRADED